MIAVSDSTPLIALARIGRLKLLHDFFQEIYIPEEVYDEVVRRGKDLPGAAEVEAASFIKVENADNKVAVDALSISLDRGEAEAIVLAEKKKALLIIDDGDGRRTAELLGLKITGTIGILLLASKEGILDLKQSLEDLRAVGFRISDREYEKILSLQRDH
jgi:predicted nucleic acid-binding protein